MKRKMCAICGRPVGNTEMPVFERLRLVLVPVQGALSCASCGRSGANVLPRAGVRG